MMKAKLDERAAFAKQGKISDIKAGMDRAKLEHKIASRKVLNEEQLTKWKKMRREMGPRGRHHKGGPGHCMGPGSGVGPSHMMGPGCGMGHGKGFGPGMMPEMPDAPEPSKE
jgi:hypothetical protein